jgi:hypothetical protein
MEGIMETSASRLAEYARAHPEISICQVDDIWRAWLPAGGCAGGEVHGRDEDELLAKLAAAGLGG